MLIFAILLTAPISVNAASVLEDLEAPLEIYLREHTNETVGRSIWDMTFYNDKLYIGWGDYGGNLGTELGGIPLIRYFDATNTWLHETILDDEQISRFFEYDGKLYMPGTDPIKRVGSLYVGDKSGSWEILSTFDGGIHVFDMLVNDNIVYLSYGQDYGAKAVIRYSTDGETFEDIEFRYDGKPIIPKGNAFARSYNLFSFNGEIYATLSILNGSEEYGGLYKLNKTEMVFSYVGERPKQLTTGGLAPEFDGEFLGHYFYADGTLSYTDNIEDAESWKTLEGINGKVTCAKVIDESLYFVAYRQNGEKYTSTLYKTKDLKTTEVVYSLDYNAYIQSFCYGNGKFYLGTGCDKTKPNSAAGTVFSLSTKKSEKMDIVIKTHIEGLDEKSKPQWVKYRLKVGDTVVEEGSFNKIYGWETTFEDFDAREDWSVEVIEDSVGHEWMVENNNGVFTLKNKVHKETEDQEKATGDKQNQDELTLILVITGGIILVIGAVITALVLTRKKKSKTAEETKE